MLSAIDAFLGLPEADRWVGPVRIDPGRKLGEGGFAPVFLCDEIHAGVILRTVAVKVFALDADTTLESVRRAKIVEEARALCQVLHPNVVRFHALHTNEARRVVALSMEYVAGQSLAEKLATSKMSVHDILEVGESVASALAAVHAAGLVHRDVKPANVIDASGVYKLIDFGIASGGRSAAEPRPVLLGDFVVDATHSMEVSSGPDEVSGTLGYIDPVSLKTGAPSTASGDLYALGATLFECACGKLPATAATSVEGGSSEDYRSVLYGDASPPSIGLLRTDLPAGFVKLVDGLLAPDPALRPRSADIVAHTLGRLRAERRGRRPLPPEDVGPFRGLARFELEDEDLFFGRSTDIAATLQLLRERGFVLLAGASGTGKSSLARAGVAPRVVRGELGGWPRRWQVIVVSPGRDPLPQWLAAFAELDPALDVPPSELAAALEARAARTDEGLLVIVDQLEELVTTVDPAKRAEGLHVLFALGAHPLPGVRVLGAARRDLLDALLGAGDRSFGAMLTRGTLLVRAFGDTEWESVVTEGLAAFGYRFEDAALERELLAELRGSADGMPLIEFALSQLWKERDMEARMIRRSSLRSMGGIEGALERHAEATFLALSAPDAEIARRTLLLLTTAQGTRATLPRDRLPDGAATDALLARFLEARLLVREGDGYTLAHEALLTAWGRLRAWGEEVRAARALAEELERTAKHWENTKDKTLYWRGRMLASVRGIDTNPAIALSTPARLFLAGSRATARRTRVLLGVLALFTAAAASVAIVVYVRRLDASRRAASLAETRARSKAEEERRQLLAALEEQGRAELASGNASRAILLLGRSLDLGGDSETLRFLLAEAFAGFDDVIGTIAADMGKVTVAKFSPGGARLLLGTQDGKLAIWDWGRQTKQRDLEGQPAPLAAASFDDASHVTTMGGDDVVRVWDLDTAGPPRSAAFSERLVAAHFADGEVVAAGASGATYVVDLATRRTVGSLPPGEAPIVDVRVDRNALSVLDVLGVWTTFDRATWAPRRAPLPAAPKPEKRTRALAESAELKVVALDAGVGLRRQRTARFAFSAGDTAVFAPSGNVALVGAELRTSDGAVLTSFDGASTEKCEGAFQPNGARVALPLDDEKVGLFDAATGVRTTTLDPGVAVRAMCFRSDGAAIAMLGNEAGALMDASGPRLAALRGSACAFSPDGALLVTFDRGRDEILLYDAATGAPRGVASIPGAMLTDFAITGGREGRTLAAVGLDGNLYLIDPAAPSTPPTVITTTASLLAVAWSPDGTLLVTAGNHGVVQARSADGQLLFDLPHPDAAVGDVAFSPVGERIATACHDGRARIFNRQGRLLGERSPPPDRGQALQRVRWSADGSLLGTSGSSLRFRYVFGTSLESRPREEVDRYVADLDLDVVMDANGEIRPKRR